MINDYIEESRKQIYDYFNDSLKKNPSVEEVPVVFGYDNSKDKTLTLERLYDITKFIETKYPSEIEIDKSLDFKRNNQNTKYCIF